MVINKKIFVLRNASVADEKGQTTSLLSVCVVESNIHDARESVVVLLVTSFLVLHPFVAGINSYHIPRYLALFSGSSVQSGQF